MKKLTVKVILRSVSNNMAIFRKEKAFEKIPCKGTLLLEESVSPRQFNVIKVFHEEKDGVFNLCSITAECSIFVLPILLVQEDEKRFIKDGWEVIELTTTK